ncbi:protein yippee-like 1 isoform X1 [Hypanus sabinus]|uniref:protein yippee-like 1 isoform X1 n=1 Tax=Hypanus sabinus TaxID=79690 RepID=UPI0028C39977|nr:protein yippee-like 1 isoform X1 [Hypanus sabinus]
MAPSCTWFQRLMDAVGRDLDFAFIYLDDILIASSCRQEHLYHLQQLYSCLSVFGLTINPAKCQFGLNTINFLGHRITKDRATPVPAKVDAIRHFARPNTVKGLQEFVGMVNFYHHFLPSAARIMRPLYTLTSGKGKDITWDEEAVAAFVKAKEASADTAMLVHPRTDVPTALTVDASDTAVGGVLEQLIERHWQSSPSTYDHPNSSTVLSTGSCGHCI